MFFDNGDIFIGQRMDLWACRSGPKIDFPRPIKTIEGRGIRLLCVSTESRGYEVRSKDRIYLDKDKAEVPYNWAYLRVFALLYDVKLSDMNWSRSQSHGK